MKGMRDRGRGEAAEHQRAFAADHDHAEAGRHGDAERREDQRRRAHQRVLPREGGAEAAAPEQPKNSTGDLPSTSRKIEKSTAEASTAQAPG